MNDIDSTSVWPIRIDVSGASPDDDIELFLDRAALEKVFLASTWSFRQGNAAIERRMLCDIFASVPTEARGGRDSETIMNDCDCLSVYDAEGDLLISVSYGSGFPEYESTDYTRSIVESYEHAPQVFAGIPGLPLLYLTLCRLLETSPNAKLLSPDDFSKWSSYEFTCRMQSELYSLGIEKSNGLSIYYDSFGKSFDLDVLEGAFDSTIYEWAHLFMFYGGVYKLILTKKEYKKAEKVVTEMGGCIYGSDENDEIDDLISEVQWNLKVFCALTAKRKGWDISWFRDYMTAYGIDYDLSIVDGGVE